jgi:hypothetical protein
MIGRAAAVLCLIALVQHAASAQDGMRPPDFSQAEVAPVANEVAEAWKAYRQNTRNLEQEVFRLPMADARVRVQRALGAALFFLDRRRAYTEKVAAHIERHQSETADRRSFVSVEIASRDELEVLNSNLTDLVDKLEALRSSPQQWVRIRRGVQADQTAMTALQSKRREDIPVDSLFHPAPPKPISAIVYRDSAQQVREVLERVWLHYYQGVIDAVEQKPNGSVPLITTLTRGADNPPAADTGHPIPTPAVASAPRDARQTDSAGINALAGTWGYLEGTQQFNGVAEPHQVILELWVEEGVLVGRYRAELPDFDGVRKVDLRLRARAAKGSQPTLQIQAGDSAAAGEFLLEDAGSGGLNIMLVRSVKAGSPVPRGRELLTRR